MIPPLFKRKNLPDYSIYKLYWHPENIRYVKAQIIYAIEDSENEMSGNGAVASGNIAGLLRSKPEKLNFVEEFMKHEVIYNEDNLPTLVLLHNQNVNMIFRTAQQISEEPGSILSDEFDRIGDDGKPEYGEYAHTAYSFRGGQWHPEDIFMESAANREKAYWKPLEVTFDPSKRGPGNHWTNETNPYNFNPYRIHGRHFAPIEPNCEDRRVNSVYKLPY